MTAPLFPAEFLPAVKFEAPRSNCGICSRRGRNCRCWKSLPRREKQYRWPRGYVAQKIKEAEPKPGLLFIAQAKPCVATSKEKAWQPTQRSDYACMRGKAKRFPNRVAQKIKGL